MGIGDLMSMNRIEIQVKSQRLADQFTSTELWDRYRAAKLIEDKEEVRLFRKAIDIQKSSQQDYVI
jgi:hypothetical protein